ncbi:hypothetical protein HMPREF9163_00909 [Selenomonas sp. oral taxon 138 str. F0429]|nr:hypothetical protein HMPREF9163_00909 [Selenomonas sp. oral taxon 138 str. F0429]
MNGHREKMIFDGNTWKTSILQYILHFAGEIIYKGTAYIPGRFLS